MLQGNNIAYFSPLCRSPTALGRFILCRAQSTVPAPVAASPALDLLALLTAS